MTEISSLLLATVLFVGVSCSSKPPADTSRGAAVNSGQADIRGEIKGQWEQRCKTLDEKKLGRDYPGKKLDILFELLEQAPAAQVNAERERIRRASGDYPTMDEYDRTLLQSLYLMSAKKKDRDGLVYLLSAKCPRFIAGSAIELEVASLEIDHPLGVLFDSYDKADSERPYLLDILRHAFKALSKEHPDDRDFVGASRSWYLANESQIKPNPYYHPFVDFAEQRDLFVSKH